MLAEGLYSLTELKILIMPCFISDKYWPMVSNTYKKRKKSLSYTLVFPADFASSVSL
jgi:hypothetical protein